ncbi:hypothetical protein GUITHDRAFT_142043 [Guillardia theta CCMP2712]|uniref:RRM domain-containing protein n=1 Tax=Guillardia theta (strain CCMP2712) TaxID=905079 RepID=L1IYJ8_GUITC|nr:hypothetical protein GUITHDRAFT_142043 [Guillardia theta CCMP2712]EKX41338.1 hypothetical protein GUITHDRAFT_142043 [Guillardia theta CCMP2712]|eukprot:XP_005828318.1 hypothetical protein GUITHDRAFT_142043 [Guillardia theta CCMP2712]
MTGIAEATGTGARRDGISAEEVKSVFERFGKVRDVYIPTDYHTKRPKPFAFIEFLNGDDARDAKDELDNREICGRKVSVLYAQRGRTTPDQMRARDSSDRSPGRSRRSRSRDRPRLETGRPPKEARGTGPRGTRRGS